MARYIGWWSFLDFGYWAIEEKATGVFVGDVGFMDALREIEPSIVGLPEVGWVLAPAHHGKGYASEALHAVLEWADRTLAASQTVALIATDNAPSMRLGRKFDYRIARTIDFSGEPTAVLYRPRNGRQP